LYCLWQYRFAFFVPKGEFVSLLFSLPTFPHRGTKKKVIPSKRDEGKQKKRELLLVKNRETKTKGKAILWKKTIKKNKGRNNEGDL
jgi:hypothetical protein